MPFRVLPRLCLSPYDARMASSMGTVPRRTNQVGAVTESAKLKSPLSILHLEDDPNDAALIQSALAEIICSITRVQTRDDFLATLEREASI